MHWRESDNAAHVFHDLIVLSWLNAMMMRSVASMFAQGKARLFREYVGARHTDWGDGNLHAAACTPMWVDHILEALVFCVLVPLHDAQPYYTMWLLRYRMKV